MKLTEDDVALLKIVRENMQWRYDHGISGSAPYICWNLIEAKKGRNCMFDGPSLKVVVREMGGQIERLHRIINWALGNAGSMKTYIGRNTWQFGPKFVQHANSFEHEARLAWLDRMIEMKEIK